MEAYKQRVINEKEDLDTKLNSLTSFTRFNELFHELNPAEQMRLRRQVLAMAEYSNILGERIEAFH